MSWQSAVARRSMRPETAKPGIDVARSRAYASRRTWLPKPPKGWRLETQQTDVRGEWLRPSTPPRATILYFHGGGYYFCSPQSHRAITFGLAKRAQASVLSLDYRLAPEQRFPAAVEDAVAAYRALLAAGTAPTTIVIGGDSAGAAGSRSRRFSPCAMRTIRCPPARFCFRPGRI